MLCNRRPSNPSLFRLARIVLDLLDWAPVEDDPGDDDDKCCVIESIDSTLLGLVEADDNFNGDLNELLSTLVVESSTDSGPSPEKDESRSRGGDSLRVDD